MLMRTLALTFLLAGCSRSTLGAPLSSGRPKVLLISFDGFRWDYDRDVDTPNLDQMALDGVKAPFVTPAFLTVTSPAHFTLLTGEANTREDSVLEVVVGGGGADEEGKKKKSEGISGN